MRRGRRILSLVALVGALTWPAVATAQPESTSQPESTATGSGPALEEVSAKLVTQGWYNEPGAGTEDARLAEVQARLASTGTPWALVALAQNPSLGTKGFGDELLDLVRAGGGPKTLVILTPTEVTASSRTYEEAELQAALAAAVPAFDRDVVAGFEALFADLTDGPAPPRPAPETSFPVVPVAGAAITAMAAAVLVVAGFKRRSAVPRP